MHEQHGSGGRSADRSTRGCPIRRWGRRSGRFGRPSSDGAGWRGLDAWRVEGDSGRFRHGQLDAQRGKSPPVALNRPRSPVSNSLSVLKNRPNRPARPPCLPLEAAVVLRSLRNAKSIAGARSLLDSPRTGIGRDRTGFGRPGHALVISRTPLGQAADSAWVEDSSPGRKTISGVVLESRDEGPTRPLDRLD